MLPLLYFVVFRYLPMVGNVIAFRRFIPGGSIFGEQWVGLRYVRMFLDRPDLLAGVPQHLRPRRCSRLLFCFPIPIVLALLLNELRGRCFKRFVQTVSYLPHFMSIVIVAGMILQLLSLDGTVNQVLQAFGRQNGELHPGRGLVPDDLRLLRGVADRRLGHDPLPGRAHPDRRHLVRGGADRRRQPVETDLARHAARHRAPPWSRC